MAGRTYLSRSATGDRLVRVGWVATAVVALTFVLVRALGATGWQWLLLSQILFVAGVWAAVAGVAYAFRSPPQGHGRSTWVVFLAGCVILALGETYYSVFQVTSDIAGPPAPSVFDGLVLVGGLVLVWALVHGTSLGDGSRSDTLLAATDTVAIALLGLVGLYWFASWMVDDPGVLASASIEGVSYVGVGVAIVLIVSVNVATARGQGWGRWQTVFASALGLFGLSMALWPISRFLTRDEVAMVVEVGIATSFLVSYLLMMLAALYRVSDGGAGRKTAVDFLRRHRARRSESVALPTVLLGAILALGALALRAPGDSVDASVYLGSMVLLGAVMVARTMTTGARTGALRVHAGSDPLTGLMNLRSIRARLSEAIRSCEKYGEPVTVVLLDLDDFERTNLLYGRDEGDRLLCAAADVLSAAVGQRGCVGRIGGDEFVVIMHRTSGEEASAETARLREALRTVLSTAGLPLTASWGIAACPDHAQHADELLRQADAGQYWAKRHGKDRVILYDPAESGTLASQERPMTVEARADLDVLLAVVVGHEARVPASRFHSRNVAAVTVLVAERLGVESDQVRDFEIAALLHDIGMIGLPDRIGRAGHLRKADEQLYQEHVLLGESIVASSTLSRVAALIRSHHERWDGLGFPDGLAAEEIPLGARIIAACDVFEHMTTGSGLSPALSRGAALQALDQAMGRELDPTVVEAVIAVVAELPSEGWIERGEHR